MCTDNLGGHGSGHSTQHYLLCLQSKHVCVQAAVSPNIRSGPSESANKIFYCVCGLLCILRTNVSQKYKSKE